MSSNRFAVALTVGADDVELVADRLFALGASAVAEQPVVEQPGTGDAVTLVADLDADGLDALRGAGSDPLVLEPEAAWDDGWRAHARAWRCGQRIVLRPTWVEPGVTGRHDVEILMEPGHAFGSGSHATTRLCVAAVERLAGRGVSMLDVGCGTGVLAVVAARLGCEPVQAIDVDPHAVGVTVELARLNRLDGRVAASTVALGDVADTFDLVVANLLAPIIEDLADDLVDRVAPAGTLVLGGVLADQRSRVEAALPVMRVVSDQELDGWITLEMVRR